MDLEFSENNVFFGALSFEEVCKIDDASCSVLYVYIIYICVCVCVNLFRVYIDFAFRLLGNPQNADENLPGIPSNTI